MGYLYYYYAWIVDKKNNRLKAVNGARSRNRTGTAGLGPTDFKSVVSTYFTTRA